MVHGKFNEKLNMIENVFQISFVKNINPKLCRQ